MSNAALTVVKPDWLEDWYVIEWAEHDGRRWMEEIQPGHLSLRKSARVGDADPEGTAAEMLACADAIENHECVSFRRVAVSVQEDRVEIWSPRNSQHPAEVPYSRALELAHKIREVCGAAMSEADPK